MVLTSLKEGLGYLREMPVLWLGGLSWGIFSAATLLLAFSENEFLAENIGILMIIVIPFFIGGIYGVIQKREPKLSVFMQQGAAYYFPVLLPSIMLFLAALLTVTLIVVTLALLGNSPGAGQIVPVISGVMVSILFFTFFYDTAAVFEGKKVFDSIKRSIEIVLTQPFKCLLFYITLILLFLLINFVAEIALVALMAEQLEPIASMNQTALQSMTAGELKGLLGERGVLLTGGILLIASTLYFSIIYAFKAAFYRRISGEEQPQAITGEYDEKGRWYKY